MYLIQSSFRWVSLRSIHPLLFTNDCVLHQIKPTLEILSLLHWLTPLLTLTTHSTARFRACWTSSRAGTMVMLGMERVTFILKIACWPLLLSRLGESLSATGGEKNTSETKLCDSKKQEHELTRHNRQRSNSQDRLYGTWYTLYGECGQTAVLVWHNLFSMGKGSSFIPTSPKLLLQWKINHM